MNAANSSWVQTVLGVRHPLSPSREAAYRVRILTALDSLPFVQREAVKLLRGIDEDYCQPREVVAKVLQLNLVDLQIAEEQALDAVRATVRPGSASVAG
ncbi:MAG: hypothetical protein HY369_01425 [Candidatus Aenigmarchaeota archaeon]|nr:hypothetical protein [Candidatus Aenigmarchaeota archaeon]